MSKPRRQSRPKRKDVPKQPCVMIFKRDGRVQPFTCAKLVTSIRNSGATQKEVDLVTNRVSKRISKRESVSSKELSSMVARSLSRVNPTASKNYVNNRNQKLAYTQRVNSLNSEIGALNQKLNSVPQRIGRVNERILSLPTRIAQIRDNNYRTLSHLETEQTSLSELWTNLSPELRSITSLQSETVTSQLQDLRQTLTYRLKSPNYDLGNFQDIDSQLSVTRTNISELQRTVANRLTPIEKKLQNLDKDLRKAENTVSLVANASFPWETDETPIIAVKAKDLDNDLDGFITLTNRRFILEHQKEIILKKRLFIVTEKKVIREVAVEKPIGMVTRLVRGKVGFLKGAGLFVDFVPESGLPEMKFDTTGQDADWVTQSYNDISSGKVEEELATIAAVDDKEEEPRLITCHICGAPYTEKIYRGQTSVNCKYCGAVVAL